MIEYWENPESEYSSPQQVSESQFFSRGRSSHWRSGERKPRVDNGRDYTFSRKDDRNLIVRIHYSKVGRIIGKQGAKIKELEKRTNTKIKIGEPCRDDEFLTEIIIVGTDHSQQECKRLIDHLASDDLDPSTDFLVEKPGQENESFACINWDAVNKKAEIAEKERWKNAPPLIKNFYVEHPEVQSMTKEEVDEFRKSNSNIIVELPFGGDDKIFNPVKTFAQAFQLYPDIINEIERQGFKTPSPIQCQAWPILLSGRDLIGVAQTGTGKTLAFLLPALIHIDGQKIPRVERGGANVLILAPTRELALQIEKEVLKYTYKNIKCVCVYGGGNRQLQVDTVTDGVEIIIATPGRLNDLIEASVIDVSSITYLVLDEADRMLDMGFEPQIRKTLLDIRPDRQTVMTSATWNVNVQRLAEKYMDKPVQVYIGSLDLAAVHSVTQTVWVIDEEQKDECLLNFIESLTQEDKTIVFVGKKKRADSISCDLVMRKISCQSIHGDREQFDREQAIEDFKTGQVKILVATDVASRGLDILDITKVFNYDFPKNIEEYVHRVGRTGRAGRTGEAVTLFTRSDWAYAGELITIMEEANQEVPEELFSMRDRYQSMQKRRNEERLYAASRDRGGGRGRGGGFSGRRGNSGFRGRHY